MLEIWKDIEGTNGIYQVSNKGRIRSFSKKMKGNILKQSSSKKGYLNVGIVYPDGKRKTKQVHRLVAEAFISNSLKLPQVNHKDENKMNNQVDNLEWCTNQYNFDYSFKRHPDARKRWGASKNFKKINQYDKDWNFIRTWNNSAEAGRALGINSSSIQRSCRAKRKFLCCGYRWEFAE